MIITVPKISAESATRSARPVTRNKFYYLMKKKKKTILLQIPQVVVLMHNSKVVPMYKIIKIYYSIFAIYKSGNEN